MITQEQRIKDLENVLKVIQKNIIAIKEIDVSEIQFLSFEDGFKHANKIAADTVNLFVKAYIK